MLGGASDARIATPDHALYRLRGFFTRRFHGRTIPEQYEEHTRSRVGCARTRGRERGVGTTYPPLNAELLDLYFQDYVDRKFLPQPARRRRSDVPRTKDQGPRTRTKDQERNVSPFSNRCCETHFDDDRLAISRMDLVQQGSEHSIISELTSWQHGSGTGLFHYTARHQRSATRPFAGSRGQDQAVRQDVLNVAETTAAICDPCVHRELTRFRDRIGVSGGHLRELEIYGLQEDRRFREHMPLCYGTWRDDEDRSWGLLLERLDGMALMDAADDASAWTDGHIATAIDGMAELHAAWLGRDDELVDARLDRTCPDERQRHRDGAALGRAGQPCGADVRHVGRRAVGANARAAREHDSRTGGRRSRRSRGR